MGARHRLGWLAAAATIVVACSDAKVYVYTAQKWNPAASCLEEYVPIETVDGDGADSTCPAACLSVGDDLYVSTLCPPLPANATPVPATDPVCKEALAAEAQKRACAGPVAAPDAAEGGEDVREAGEDASVEADAAEAGTDADADATDARDD